MRTIISLASAVSLLFAALPASAAIYKWVDEKGVVNFTEDFGKVPQRFHNKVKVVGEDQSAEPTVVIQDVKDGKGEKPAPAEPSKKESAQPKKAVFGGKDEGYWKEEFAKAKYELKGVRDQIEAVNARMSKSDQMSRSEYKTLENTRKLLEEQELAVRKRLEALEAEARKAGVPPNIR